MAKEITTQDEMEQVEALEKEAQEHPDGLSFSKRVTSASVTLAEPMEAGEPITLCALSVSGSIPADAAFQVEVTNNAKDPAPVWEDCTTAARNGLNHIFTNQTATNGAAFNFRINAERGGSGQGGYFTSIQGGFQ